MPYIYKCVKTKHKDFVTRTKCFYYNPSHSKGRRGIRSVPTSESRQKRNKRNAYLNRKYQIYNNFDIGDMWVTLTWKQEALGEKTPSEAHAVLTDVLAKVRKKLARQNIPFVYYAKTEAGNNMRAHHHIIIKSNFPVADVIYSYWKPYGKIRDFSEIYNLENGKLVSYMLDCGGHKELTFEKYTHSRNLKEPEVEKRVYQRDSFRENPRPPQDTDEIHYKIENLYNGYADIDGYTYQAYEIRKIRKTKE